MLQQCDSSGQVLCVEDKQNGGGDEGTHHPDLGARQPVPGRLSMLGGVPETKAVADEREKRDQVPHSQDEGAQGPDDGYPERDRALVVFL